MIAREAGTPTRLVRSKPLLDGRLLFRATRYTRAGLGLRTRESCTKRFTDSVAPTNGAWVGLPNDRQILGHKAQLHFVLPRSIAYFDLRRRGIRRERAQLGG